MSASKTPKSDTPNVNSSPYLKMKLLLPILAALLTTPALSQISVSLYTEADTTNLFLDQPFTIQVRITGLTPTQELEFLGVTAATDPLRMATPTALSRGEIVPTPTASPQDFLSARTPGQADASFYTSGTLPQHRIRTNGTFFTFDLTPRRAGSVTIDVIFAQALIHNIADPTNPTEITITPAAPLEVTIFCPADYNNDGAADGSDVQDFFDAWVAAEPRADVNGDSGIDGEDVSAFFAAWENGGC